MFFPKDWQHDRLFSMHVYIFQLLVWSALISAQIHHLQHPWMMLHLHSGPCQIRLSVSQLSEEGTLAFWIKSADVWKLADSHYLNRDRQWDEECDSNKLRKCVTPAINAHYGVSAHATTHRLKSERGEEEEGRWRDGSWGERIKHLRRSRKKVERKCSHNSIEKVGVQRGQDLSPSWFYTHFSINSSLVSCK